MTARITVQLIAMFSAMFVNGVTAFAGLPEQRIVEYVFRETPTDPKSNIVLKAYLHIKPIDSNGPTISWSISSSWYESIDSSGAVEASWTLDDPHLDTVDGLWYTTHADTSNPAIAEFTDLPEVSGVASPDKAGQADLDVVLAVAAPSSSGMYGGNVGDSTYSFLTINVPIGAVVVDKDDEDEPVEVDGDEFPPGG